MSGRRGQLTPAVTSAWVGALASFEDHQRAERRPESTRAKRAKHLRLFATTGGVPSPWDVTRGDLERWLARQGWAESTTTTYRSTLRVFYAWAVGTGRVRVNPSACLSRVNGPDDELERPLGTSGPLPAHVPQVWLGPLAEYARELRIGGAAAGTIRLRIDQLGQVARGLDPLGPFDVDVYALAEWLGRQEWSVETRRSRRTTLRGFYTWAVEAGHIGMSPADRLPRPGVGRPNPRPAAEYAVHVAIAAATPRERLMVRLAAEVGLRRTEVARVHSRDLLEGVDGWSLLVHGKGARDRLVPLPAQLAGELRGLPEGWAFPSDRGGHLTPRRVGNLVSALLPEGVTMHALRHRFATRAYGLSSDVFAVQQLLGHASPETTRRYVAVAQERLRATVDDLAASTTRSPTVRHLAAAAGH